MLGVRSSVVVLCALRLVLSAVNCEMFVCLMVSAFSHASSGTSKNNGISVWKVGSNLLVGFGIKDKILLLLLIVATCRLLNLSFSMF